MEKETVIKVFNNGKHKIFATCPKKHKNMPFRLLKKKPVKKRKEKKLMEYSKEIIVVILIF